MKRPGVGSSAVVTSSSGEAVISCEIEMTSRARALREALELPVSCSVGAVQGGAFCFADGEALAELLDRGLVERLLVCMKREITYSAVLRSDNGLLVAEVTGG